MDAAGSNMFLSMAWKKALRPADHSSNVDFKEWYEKHPLIQNEEDIQLAIYGG